MPRLPFVFLQFLGYATALAFAGCVSHRQPIVVVSEVVVAERSDEAIRVDFVLDLDNPNQAAEAALRLDEFRYQVSIDGARAYEGVRAAQATLAPADHRQLTIPAVIRYDTMGWSTQSVPQSLRFAIKGSLTYIAPGELSRTFREMGLPAPRANFQREAEVAVQVE